MGLRGTKAMFRLAKALAISKDVRMVGTGSSDSSRMYAGYGLSQNEITNLFFSEGFTHESTVRKFEGLWQKCGWAVPAANGFMFFVLDPEEDHLALLNMSDTKKDLSRQGNPDCIIIGSEVSA